MYKSHRRSLNNSMFSSHPCIDFQNIFCCFAWLVDRTWIRCARFCGMYFHDIEVFIYPEHIQRNQSIFHPKIIDICYFKYKKHSWHLRHRFTIHQSPLMFFLCTSDLYHKALIISAYLRFIIILIPYSHTYDCNNAKSNYESYSLSFYKIPFVFHAKLPI